MMRRGGIPAGMTAVMVRGNHNFPGSAARAQPAMVEQYAMRRPGRV